jgi:hypothetical protein
LAKSHLSIITYFLARAESNHSATAEWKTGCIIDSSNRTWKILPNQRIDVDGKTDWDTDKVELLVYWNRIVYQQNAYKEWWKWIDNKWVGTSDPRLTASSPTTPKFISALPRGSFNILSTQVMLNSVGS